jgi:hypothetical protein
VRDLTDRGRLADVESDSLPPSCEPLGSDSAILAGREAVAAGTEVVTDGTEDRQEGLNVPGRLEALHHSLSLAYGKVRILSTIVQAFVVAVIDVGQDSPDGRWVSRELVGDDDSRLVANSGDDLLQEPFGGMLITSRLDQDVEHDTVLVDRSPQPVAMTTDADRYFVEMSFVAGSCSSSA